jgi:2'-5' RNA ligase
MKDTVRTFIAVETSPPVRQRAVDLIRLLDAAGADVRWVERSHMHLTLKFLDDVPLREIPRISDAIQQVTSKIEPFDVAVRGAGAFPDVNRPKTVWIGVGDGVEPLGELFAAVEDAMAHLGFRKEPRRFEAHLTLGRTRGGGPAVAELGRLLQQASGFEAGSFRVTEVVLFSSLLTPKGPIYDALSRSKLGKGARG